MFEERKMIGFRSFSGKSAKVAAGWKDERKFQYGLPEVRGWEGATIEIRSHSGKPAKDSEEDRK